MPADVILQTWREISQYVGRTERTLQRWEQQFGFPVHRPSGQSRSSVMALTREIQDWARGKPSLVVIRRSTRLSREAPRADARARNNSDNHRIERSFDLCEPGLSEIVGNRAPHRAASERIRLSKSLCEKQKNLREDVTKLLREHRRLCEKLFTGVIEGAVLGPDRTVSRIRRHRSDPN